MSDNKHRYWLLKLPVNCAEFPKKFETFKYEYFDISETPMYRKEMASMCGSFTFTDDTCC